MNVKNEIAVLCNTLKITEVELAKEFLAAHQIGDGKCRFHRIKS